MYIYIAAIIIGLILFAVGQTSSNTQMMLLCWSLGSISNLFVRQSWLRKQVGNIFDNFRKVIGSGSLYKIVGGLIGVIIGTIVVFAVIGALAPVFLIAYIIGIIRVKKQIAANDAILNQLRAGNNNAQN
jgi:small-conductance mechanosensitive channel